MPVGMFAAGLFCNVMGLDKCFLGLMLVIFLVN